MADPAIAPIQQNERHVIAVKIAGMEVAVDQAVAKAAFGQARKAAPADRR